LLFGWLTMFHKKEEKEKREEEKESGNHEDKPLKFDREVILRTEAFEKVLREVEQESPCPSCSLCGAKKNRTVVSLPSVFVINVLWDVLQIDKERVWLSFPV